MMKKRILLVAMSLLALVFVAQASQAAGRFEAKLVSLSTARLDDACGPKEACCPKPCITYRHGGPKLCCECKPGTPTTLKVKDPCTCCETEIAFCLPACCTGEPTICCGSGIFGRDVVTYEWCCGFRVKVAFKQCGDLIVTTWGR